ncbi:hypothetical protein QIS74_04217 [Colletotrichum tabaci]|uniref:Uncharacterized protein n=1 Tax=Colletotrichum tabaci TaxID=1209068 RepID=A0AAV9TKS9_9PEZI
MASQPPAGIGPLPASPAGPDRGPGPPPEPISPSRAKRRRNTETQPLRPSLAGSQPNTFNPAPPTAKGPPTLTSATGRTATGSVLSALDEEARHYEARKDVFLTVAQSVDNVVSSFEGPRKQIAKEATAYVIQALKKFINRENAPTLSRSWAAVTASAPATAPDPHRAPTHPQARPQTKSQAQPQPRPQPKEDLRVFARIPEEGLSAARKNAPFALRQTVCRTFDLQLADIPHIYHIATGYSLRPSNKQIQQGLLAEERKLAACLGAYKIETPIKWFTYVVPRCPAKLWSVDGDALDPATLIEDEVFAQTRQKPTRARQSRLGPDPITNKVSWVISFLKETQPFRLFNQSSRSQLIQKRKTLIRHDPGCQGYHSNSYCNRHPLCNNCGRPSDSHETGPCTAKPQCANCCGPSQASHKNCPARPMTMDGIPALPDRKERARIRKVGQKAYDALYEISLKSSIVCLGDGDTDSSSMSEDEPEDAEGTAQTNRAILPLLNRSQRVAQKPDYNVANAYTHLELDLET